MLISLQKVTFRDQFDRILMLFVLHGVLFICAKLYELLRYEFSLLNIFLFIGWLVYYRFFYRMLKFLYYSFWPMCLISTGAIIYSMVASYHIYSDLSLFYFYFLSISTLFMSSYIVNSPIYYPIVSWWEYDFRYRNDIVTTVTTDDGESEKGRLIDLRRYSGGLTFFRDLKVGTKLTIKPEYNELEKEFKVEIISKRATTIGRPYTYGLQFDFETEDAKKDFVVFQKFWQFERKYKQKAKFNKS